MSRDPATGTISLTNGGQDSIATDDALGTNGSSGSGKVGEVQDASTTGEGQNTENKDQDQDQDVSVGDTAAAGASGIRYLSVYTYDEELSEAIKDYVERHPELNLKVNFYVRSSISEAYFHKDLNESLQGSGPNIVDIYCVPDTYSHEVIKGEFSKHAYAYRELGIDVDAAVKKADIPQYIVDAGTNQDGEVISLPFRRGAIVFVYRRSVARDVWGTDDPDKIAGIIGAGTGKWDRFLDAAETLKEHGCYIVPSIDDIAYAIDTDIQKSIVGPDTGFEINPEWQEFLALSEKMLDNGYIPKTQHYFTEEWCNALNGKGDKPVLGFIVPYDLIKFLLTSDEYLKSTAGDWAICVPPVKTFWQNYTGILVNRASPNKDVLGPIVEWLTLDISEKGLQYNLANDTMANKNDERYNFHGGKWPVISGTILRNTENRIDFLGGQDVNPVLYDAVDTPTGKHNYMGLERELFSIWTNEVKAYLAGEKNRKNVEDDYVKAAKDMYDWYKKQFDEYGVSFLLP